MRIARRVMPALATLLVLTIGFAGPARAQDPPDRAGRLSYLGGDVSFRPGGADDWTAATLNYPVTTGDDIWADDRARAEIVIGSAAIRLAPSTALGFLALDDQTTQVRLTQGTLQVRVRDLADDEIFEIDTPNGSVSLLRPGSYRVDVDANGDATTLTVRDGRAELTAAGASLAVDDAQAAIMYGVESPSYDMQDPVPPDEWERWAATRDRRRDDSPSAQYVARDMPGYEDLDDYGYWRQHPQYGIIWTPRQVPAGWTPYRNGHWAWVEPWGWTWIDDAPWGFAPYHYGRWVYAGRGWAWVPGRVVARSVYAPALVAFVGGSNWSISVGVGGGVGWFPLGPQEIYVPAYRVSDRYVRNINITTINVTNLTLADMTNVRYRNRSTAGAVTVVTRETFLGGRPVGRSLIVVPRDRLNSAPVVGTAAPFAPTRESWLRPSGRPVRVPRTVIVTRRVVVRTAPPPPPVPYTARERAWQAHPGRPLDDATLGKLREQTRTGQNPYVRPATGDGGRGMRPTRRGLPDARPVEPTTQDRRRWRDVVPRDGRQGDADRPMPPGREHQEDRPRGYDPGRDDHGRSQDHARPQSEPASGAPALPTPPRLPAEPGQPAKPPAPPPQDRGHHPQPEPRPPATPEGHPKDEHGQRPQPEPPPPTPPTAEQPKAAEPPAAPPKEEKGGWRRSLPKPPPDTASSNPR